MCKHRERDVKNINKLTIMSVDIHEKRVMKVINYDI
jgi:hypothetical protein